MSASLVVIHSLIRSRTVTWSLICLGLVTGGDIWSLQGGKKLRDHRFLACLEGPYRDSVKL